MANLPDYKWHTETGGYAPAHWISTRDLKERAAYLRTKLVVLGEFESCCWHGHALRT